jgi:hypothetical protein
MYICTVVKQQLLFGWLGRVKRLKTSGRANPLLICQVDNTITAGVITQDANKV